MREKHNISLRLVSGTLDALAAWTANGATRA